MWPLLGAIKHKIYCFGKWNVETIHPFINLLWYGLCSRLNDRDMNERESLTAVATAVKWNENWKRKKCECMKMFFKWFCGLEFRFCLNLLFFFYFKRKKYGYTEKSKWINKNNENGSDLWGDWIFPIRLLYLLPIASLSTQRERERETSIEMW